MSLGRHKNREKSLFLPKNVKLLFSFASFRFKFVLFRFFLFCFAWFCFRLISFRILKYLFRFEAKQAKLAGQFPYFAKKKFRYFASVSLQSEIWGTPYPCSTAVVHVQDWITPKGTHRESVASEVLICESISTCQNCLLIPGFFAGNFLLHF